MSLVVRFDQPIEVSQLEKLFSDYGKCEVFMDPQQLHARVEFCSSRPFIDAARAKFYVIERNAIAMQVQWAIVQSLPPPKWWRNLPSYVRNSSSGKHGDNMTEGLAQEGQAFADPGSSPSSSPGSSPLAHEYLKCDSTGTVTDDASSSVLRTADPAVQVEEVLSLFRWILQLLKEQDMDGHAALLKARKCIFEEGLALNTEKRTGHVPGVVVGQKFRNRAELTIVGLHAPLRSGIDTRELAGGDKVAVSIICSGGYNDVDNGEVVEYIGQGKMKRGKQIADQTLNAANSALKLSEKNSLAIRVIRGTSTGSGRDELDEKDYEYAGLYTIFKSEFENSVGLDSKESKYRVWKFSMRRLVHT